MIIQSLTVDKFVKIHILLLNLDMIHFRLMSGFFFMKEVLNKGGT